MKKHVTVIGGGTGSYVVLSGLKDYDLDLASIVSMTDSGGSTGRLRDQLGVLPPGDVRQCLVALSEASDLWRKLFLYRFENGDLQGHNFGNIFLSALEKVGSDYNEVLATANYVLKTKGKVIPVTLEKTHLCVRYQNGKVIQGEGNIDENNNERSRIAEAYLDPIVPANSQAIERIAESDYLIVGPGDLYTSIIPVLLLPDVRDTILKKNPQIIYTMNLMTKTGQTSGYTAFDHIADLKRYLGKYPDYVIMNESEIPDEIKNWYTDHHEIPVINDLPANGFTGVIKKEELIDTNGLTGNKDTSDVLTRSILRHNSNKLSQVIHSILSA